MIQPSKNAGHLGAWREPGIGPGWRLPRGHPAKPVPACWAWQPSIPRLSWAHGAATSWGAQQRGSRGSRPLPLHHTFPAGQVASKISRFSTFAQLKRRKNSRGEPVGFVESIAGAGRQDPINWVSSIFPVHQHARGGYAGHIPLIHVNPKSPPSHAEPDAAAGLTMDTAWSSLMLLKTRLGLVPQAFGISKGTCYISILFLLMVQCTELFSISYLLGAAELLEQKGPWNASGILTLQQRFWMAAPRSQTLWRLSLCRGDMTLPCLCPAPETWGTQGRELPKYSLLSATAEQKANNFPVCLLSTCSRPSPPSLACGCLSISTSPGICSKTSLGCLGVPVGRVPVRRAGQHKRTENAGDAPAPPF